MNLEIQFIPEAVEDYTSLDGSIKKQVNEKIDKLKENPFLGEALGNKNSAKGLCCIPCPFILHRRIAIHGQKSPPAKSS